MPQHGPAWLGIGVGHVRVLRVRCCPRAPKKRITTYTPEMTADYLSRTLILASGCFLPGRAGRMVGNP